MMFKKNWRSTTINTFFDTRVKEKTSETCVEHRVCNNGAMGNGNNKSLGLATGDVAITREWQPARIKEKG
jgi:hypothetical protein